MALILFFPVSHLPRPPPLYECTSLIRYQVQSVYMFMQVGQESDGRAAGRAGVGGLY